MSEPSEVGGWQISWKELEARGLYMPDKEAVPPGRTTPPVDDCGCLPDWLANGVHQQGCKLSRCRSQVRADKDGQEAQLRCVMPYGHDGVHYNQKVTWSDQSDRLATPPTVGNCPFCGASSRTFEYRNIWPEGPAYRVECENCHAMTCYWHSKSEAEVAWVRRAAAPPSLAAIDELTAKILEAAQLHDDTDEGGKVFMPDEEQWGEIVGLAREYVKSLQ